MNLPQEAHDLLELLIRQARATNDASALGPLIEAQSVIGTALLHPRT